MSHRQSADTVRRILAWRAQGRTFEQIAVNLGIAPNTVRNIVRRAALATGGRPGDNRGVCGCGRPRPGRRQGRTRGRPLAEGGAVS